MIDDAYISEADLPDDTLWLAKTFKLFLPLTGPTSNQIVNPSFIWRFDCKPKGSRNCQSDFWPLSNECWLVKDWRAAWLPGRENGDGNYMGKRDHQWDALQWKVQRGFSSAEVLHPWKQKKPYKEKQRGSAELLHFGKSRTNCIAGGMGKGAGSQGTEKAWQEYRAAQWSSKTAIP